MGNHTIQNTFEFDTHKFNLEAIVSGKQIHALIPEDMPVMVGDKLIFPDNTGVYVKDVVSIQEITLTRSDKCGVLLIYCDGKIMGILDVVYMSINEGLLSVQSFHEMCRDEPVKMKLCHWTSYRYPEDVQHQYVNDMPSIEEMMFGSATDLNPVSKLKNLNNEILKQVTQHANDKKQ